MTIVGVGKTLNEGKCFQLAAFSYNSAVIVNSHSVDKNKFQSSGSINPIRWITFNCLSLKDELESSSLRYQVKAAC